MRPEHSAWIERYVAKRKGFVRGACVVASAEMAACFKELTVVRGYANGIEHAWCVDGLSGEIVDPTAAQFPAGLHVEYVPFKPGDEVRVGRCRECGEPIYAAVESLDDSKYAKEFCDDDCRDAYAASLGGLL